MFQNAFFSLTLILFFASSSFAVTTSEDAAGGCDGVKNGHWGFHVASKQKNPWWQVDLGKEITLGKVVVYNRMDNGCASRTKNLKVLVGDGDTFSLVHQNKNEFGGVTDKKPLVVDLTSKNIKARVVRLALEGNHSFALDEVEIYAANAPDKNIALGKPADQISVSPYSVKGKATDYCALQNKNSQGKNSQAVPTQAAAATNDVPTLLLACEKLTKRIKNIPPQTQKELAGYLALLQKQQQGAKVQLPSVMDVRALQKKIAFCNPRLQDIDRLLFIKRHHPGGPHHMCDQYYGCNAKPGGGLFVIEKPFSAAPVLKNLLENSVVKNGPLEGKKLEGGSFLSPEVTFDGKKIFFAYTQCKATKTYTWAEDISYHIFSCNADGSNLRQLTFGDTDDFDPCELPNGRIVFISLRRGGYLRCGRHCPVYTMFSMEPDGSDIVCLSFHETHEWHPSVTNDGMLAYTRWDYVDRDSDIAHHLWLCYPDGRDPRSYHGNYPFPLEPAFVTPSQALPLADDPNNKSRDRRGADGQRPWMEQDIRAIPGSRKFVATTGAHHGNALGTLILIDQRKNDDNVNSQLEMITPDCGIPESSRGGKRSVRGFSQYGTAWPLSEDDYLCMYDAASKNHALYWLDRDSNRVEIYRDPSIPCFSPIPLQARKRPPIIPDQTQQTARNRKGKIREATVSVVNVYDSDFQWPTGTKITALRVMGLPIKATAPPNKPRIGVSNQAGARAVLGTVPVEKDGSAYFYAPTGKALYFQALDASGEAVQSMRSDTYLHPGENLTCQGCHEPKHQPGTGAATNALASSGNAPLAMQRPPSVIKPGPSGSNPFNYPRLVQGVLDAKCVKCHVEKKALPLDGTIEKNGFTRSYNNLAKKYGYYFESWNGSITRDGSRTPVGRFGAKAAKLRKYLTKEHYKVELTADERERIVTWLDANSDFLGAFENAAAQAKGEIVEPSIW